MIDLTDAGGSTDPKRPASAQTNPTPAVMTGAQWSAAQSAPDSALASGDPGRASTNGLGRVLTGDEWSQAQRMTPGQLHQWKIPAIPVPAAPRDATRGAFDESPKGTALAPFNITDPTTYANPILRQVVDPMLAHPLASVATLAAPFALPPAAGIIAGLGIAGEGVYHIAQYGWQKAAELSLDPTTRKIAEADPERISGEAASVQAIMLGLAPLVHAGVKAVSTDFGAGMMESGVEGLKEADLGPDFHPGFDAGHKTADFAAALERGAAEAKSAPALRRPNGFTPTAEATPTRVRAKPVEGLVVPETASAVRVKPIETQPASAPLQEAADINASVREHQAQRVAQDTQDIADERTAAAERLLGLREDDAARVARETQTIVRRRPGGVKPAGETPYFESPDGATLLGTMAARTGLPDSASPYPPTSPLDVAWKTGHEAVTTEGGQVAPEATPSTAPSPVSPASSATPAGASSVQSFPERFSMGGALTDNRIPGAAEIPKAARGSNAVAGFEPTSQGATDIPATKLRNGQTLSDDPRYPSGARRPLHLVSVRGLVKELVDLEDKRVDAAGRAAYDFVPDDNFHSTEDGRSVMVADRRGGGVSRQAKALQNLEDYARIDQEVTRHLVENRGIPEDTVNELLDRERTARYDRVGAEPDTGDQSFDFGGEASSAPNPVDTVRGAQDVLDTTRREGERRSLERAAKTDELTGLGNQRAFREALPAAEENPDVSIIRFDVNGFKAVNDVHGHDFGDEVLAHIGQTIREHAQGLPVFRAGVGDEFAVFAPADRATEIRDAIEEAVGVNSIRHESGAETPYSLSGGVGDTNAAADQAAMARKVEQKAAQGIPDRVGAGDNGTGNRVSPVEGTGPARTRGLSSGVAERALANRLTLTVGDLPEYRRLNMADQAVRASKLLADDPDLAARVARGEVPAPSGLLPESVFVAVEQRATEAGDVTTLRDLATGQLTSEATTMGQRIRALAERDPESPVSAIQDIVKTRSGGAAKAASVASAIDDEVGAIDEHLAGVGVDRGALVKFIDTLRC